MINSALAQYCLSTCGIAPGILLGHAAWLMAVDDLEWPWCVKMLAKQSTLLLPLTQKGTSFLGTLSELAMCISANRLLLVSCQLLPNTCWSQKKQALCHHFSVALKASPSKLPYHHWFPHRVLFSVQHQAFLITSLLFHGYLQQYATFYSDLG